MMEEFKSKSDELLQAQAQAQMKVKGPVKYHIALPSFWK